MIPALLTVLAVLLAWHIGSEIAQWRHERERRRERQAATDRMIAAWQNKDREFMLEQRRIRGEK